MTENCSAGSGQDELLRKRLDHRHQRALLEESGLSPEVIVERGYYTAKSKEELRKLGFSPFQQRAPALVVPMYSPSGELSTHQIRPDTPREKDGKAVKYETPAKSPLRLDVHPTQAERVKDPSVPLWIVEGVKKGDSLVSQGQCAVALQGVWCWQKGGVPLPEWEEIKLWGRPVCVAFDSDVMINPKVQAALEGLVNFLKGRGAWVQVAYLPDKPSGAKQGVDDFLASGREVVDLKPFMHDGIREDLLPTGKLLSEVEPERVEWLWPGRLPLGKLAVLDGDPGLGKSAMSLDVAARVSAGLELPDGQRCEPAGVVLLSAEDGLADTIRPRLDAAGADTQRVVALSTVPDGKTERSLSIPEDLPAVERAIRRVGASLVVVDPIMAFLSGNTNSHKDQDVRRALAPLAKLAERTGAAILIVRHLNKASGGNTLYRGGGSIGIIGAARSGMVVAEDPNDPERRILAQNKQNLSNLAASLVFTVQTAPNGAARVVWCGQSELNASQILRAPLDEEEKSSLSEAKEFLQDELKEGPMGAKQVKNNAHQGDISQRTLKRAKADLGVKSTKEADGSWTWSLPKKAAEGGHSSAAGPLGTVGPLGKDADLELEISPYLWEEGQGGQGGQAEVTAHGWPPSSGNGAGPLEHPQANHNPVEESYELPGPIRRPIANRDHDDASGDSGSGNIGREVPKNNDHRPSRYCIHDVLGGCWLCQRQTSENSEKGSPKRFLEPGAPL